MFLWLDKLQKCWFVTRLVYHNSFLKKLSLNCINRSTELRLEFRSTHYSTSHNINLIVTACLKEVQQLIAKGRTRELFYPLKSSSNRCLIGETEIIAVRGSSGSQIDNRLVNTLELLLGHA